MHFSCIWRVFQIPIDSSLSNLYQKPDIMTSSRNILCLPALDKVEFSTDVGHNIFLFWYQALSMFHMPLSTFLCAWTNVLYIKTLRMHFSAGARKSREFTFSILSWLSSSIHSHTTKPLRWATRVRAYLRVSGPKSNRPWLQQPVLLVVVGQIGINGKAQLRGKVLQKITNTTLRKL